MNIFILGATGPTGQQLLQQSLERGHVVTVLVRDPGKLNIQHPQLTIVNGDALDKELILQLVEGKDAVISALGVGKSLKSHDLIYNATSLLIPAMEDKKVSRLIFISAFGVGDSFHQANWLQKLAFRLPLKNIYADKVKGDDLIRQSHIDWTLVRPVVLTNAPATGKYKAGEIMPMKGFPKVSRADVALFMVDQLNNSNYVRKSVIVMSQ